MAIAMLLEIPGLTREQYETAAQEINQPGTPAGEIFHAAGPMEGGYRVFEVWESQEAADAFYSSERFRQGTATLVMQPKITAWPVYAIDDGSGWKKTT